MATALGLDFGTTNTVLAQLSAGDETASVSFTSPAGASDTMRTALSFIKDPQLGASALQVEAGAAAIRAFIDNPGDCRFLQSIKTFAASPLFQGTLVHARRFQFEDLMEVFLKRLEHYRRRQLAVRCQTCGHRPSGAFRRIEIPMLILPCSATTKRSPGLAFRSCTTFMNRLPQPSISPATSSTMPRCWWLISAAEPVTSR